jgi:iron complex transport system ATP-binding protein
VSGPLDTTITAESLSETFDVPLQLTRSEGRYAARSRREGFRLT